MFETIGDTVFVAENSPQPDVVRSWKQSSELKLRDGK